MILVQEIGKANVNDIEIFLQDLGATASFLNISRSAAIKKFLQEGVAQYFLA